MEWAGVLCVLVALVIVLVLVLAISASREIAALRTRLEKIERRLRTPPPVPPPPVPSERPRPEAAPGEETELVWEPVPEETAEAAGAEKAPPAAVTLEERLGSRLFVWIGAVAVALAGVYLVKYAFDRNLITPPARVLLGGAFGVLLVGSSEWIRLRVRRIADAIAAAGLADLYAWIFAAANVYKLVPAAVGFALMAAVTAAGVAISLRQGAIVAVVGLVGGFLLPAMLEAAEPTAPVLLGYLFLLEVGLLVVARKREWSGLGGLNLLASAAWAFDGVARIWLAEAPKADGLWVGLYWIASGAAFIAWERTFVGPEIAGRAASTVPVGAAQGIAFAAGGLALVGLSALAFATEFSPLELWLLGAACACSLALARAIPPYSELAGLSAIFAIGLLASWSVGLVSGWDEPRFAVAALGFGALFACGSYAALWRSPNPARWAILAVVTPIACFLLAYGAIESPPLSVRWGLWSAVLAAIYGAAAAPVAIARRRISEGHASLAALVLGSAVLAILAVPMELKREWISVAWALEVVALALLERRLEIRELRFLAALLALAVGVRLAVNPNILDYPIGEAVLWNWLLYGYGIPIVAFALAAWIFRQGEDDLLVRGLEWGAVVLGLVLIHLQVRQGFHPGNLGAAELRLLEWATISVAYLLYGIGLFSLRRFSARSIFPFGGAAVGSIGLALGFFGGALRENPLRAHEGVGATPVLNWLLFVYGAPASLGFAFAIELSRAGWRTLKAFVSIASLVFIFLLVTLEVRQAFQGNFLDGPSPSNAEWYAYSAAWAALGLALLGIGIATRGVVARWASLVVMLAAVFKVFLFDTRELRDLYRVVSFLCLGAALLLLAFLYQRFVFRRE